MPINTAFSSNQVNLDIEEISAVCTEFKRGIIPSENDSIIDY
jgi:hypothetical protein